MCHHFFRRPLAVIQYFQWYCVSFKQAFAIIPFLISIELIHKSSCSHPFDELPFFYFKRVIAATHSFNFTVFLQNRNFSKGILTIILIPPWFQACTCWKNIYSHPFFLWQCHYFATGLEAIQMARKLSLFHNTFGNYPL